MSFHRKVLFHKRLDCSWNFLLWSITWDFNWQNSQNKPRSSQHCVSVSVVIDRERDTTNIPWHMFPCWCCWCHYPMNYILGASVSIFLPHLNKYYTITTRIKLDKAPLWEEKKPLAKLSNKKWKSNAETNPRASMSAPVPSNHTLTHNELKNYVQRLSTS